MPNAASPSLGGNVLVLENDLDEDHEPTDEEIRDYAEFLGIDVEKEPHLVWIAREGVVAPVPEPWKACTENGDDVFYFNYETHESVWDHPCDEKYRSMTAEHRKKHAENPQAGKNPLDASLASKPSGVGAGRSAADHSSPLGGPLGAIGTIAEEAHEDEDGAEESFNSSCDAHVASKGAARKKQLSVDGASDVSGSEASGSANVNDRSYDGTTKPSLMLASPSSNRDDSMLDSYKEAAKEKRTLGVDGDSKDNDMSTDVERSRLELSTSRTSDESISCNRTEVHNIPGGGIPVDASLAVAADSVKECNVSEHLQSKKLLVAQAEQDHGHESPEFARAVEELADCYQGSGEIIKQQETKEGASRIRGIVGEHKTAQSGADDGAKEKSDDLIAHGPELVRSSQSNEENVSNIETPKGSVRGENDHTEPQKSSFRGENETMKSRSSDWNSSSSDVPGGSFSKRKDRASLPPPKSVADLYIGLGPESDEESEEEEGWRSGETHHTDARADVSTVTSATARGFGAERSHMQPLAMGVEASSTASKVGISERDVPSSPPAFIGHGGKTSSGNSSEVSEDLVSDQELTSPVSSQHGVGVGGRSTPLGDTLELSATGEDNLPTCPPPLPTAAFSQPAAASLGQTAVNSVGASSEKAAVAAVSSGGIAGSLAARWRSTETQVESLRRSMALLKDIREKQQEYLRLINVSA
eukprot:TRINITY_DN1540_c0_g3_i1.p1 TRINITY_DN1540_c0_g3~~TRINITY_DN1540_c0_g3_i1.p1  ORF type:complete len:701 (+),score=147.07 TRINITY_DN1540_c0_g3_i1:57-2159(+)